MLLKDQIAIITGGGRGIGRAIALRFAAEGASTLVTARTAAEIASVAGEIRGSGGRAGAVAGDISLPGDCERIVAAARNQFGRVDILVNNAGIYGPVVPVQDVTPEQWNQVMAINLTGVFLLSRLVLPGMCARGSGAVLNISSVAAKVPYGLNAPYAVSKAGLLALTRTLAAETARSGVRVNAICPGPVPETLMSKELGQALAERVGMDRDEMFRQFMEGILQGRPQTADEIAAAAVFLCSREASAITGQSLNVDGGMSFY
jgi:NAD(P)-dependent dehydrogenase (short-subunit alcohol dehydrogenase family)